MVVKKNNKTVCIKMKAIIKMVVKFGKEEKTFYIDEKSKVVVSGSCGNTSRTVIITSKDMYFGLSINFEKSMAGLGVQKKSMDQWEQKSLTAYFHNDKDNTTVTVNDTKSHCKSKLNTYYKCNNGLKFTSGVATFDFSKFEVQPFSEDTKNTTKGFGDKGDVCAADSNTTPAPSTTEDNDIVPIAVGCALAGLVVIVLIAYIIGRRRTHRGYQQV